MTKISSPISIIIILTYSLSIFGACTCDDDEFIKYSKTPINNISKEDFEEYLDMHEDCIECKEDIGVNINHLKNPTYKSLIQKELSSLTENEFTLLLYLHEMGFDFQEKHDYFSNVCMDSTYIKIKQKPLNELTKQDTTFSKLLYDGCKEQTSDLEDGKLMMWKTVRDSNPNHVLKFRSFGKPFMSGAALAIGGVALLVISEEEPADNIAETLGKMIVRLFGVIVTAAGSGLFTFGAIKTAVDYDKYNRSIIELKEKPFGPDFNLGINIPITQNKESK